MALLTEEERKDLATVVLDSDTTVMPLWGIVWKWREPLDTADPSGDLRYYRAVQDLLELALGPASKEVSGSDGGGQNGQWAQHFDHLKTQYDLNLANLATATKALASQVVPSIAPLLAYSLTPTLPGFVDPASPGFMGDPRYPPGARSTPFNA